jgi:hypothetical protein
VRLARSLWLLAPCALAACGGEPLTTGLEQPFRVDGAQYRDGALPGSPPLTAADLSAGAQPVAPYPTPPEVAGRIISPADLGFNVSGRASTDTYAVGFQLAGLGTGYWLIPVSAPDPTNADELTWRAALDFGGSVPPGLQRLLVAAFDAQGRSGTQRELELCVRAPTSDNLNVCDRTLEPPALVVSLSWGNDADLDLELVAPDGSVVNRANTRGNGPGIGEVQLERDANAGCVRSGVPRENIVWQTAPAAGDYAIYVNLSDACGETSATFELSAWRRAPGDIDGEFQQQLTFETAGTLVGLQANGGAQSGLVVTLLGVD